MAKEISGRTDSGEAKITVNTPEQSVSVEECSTVQRGEPCTIVIMGATGDLTARKLIPALFNLYKNGGLPDPCIVVGCGRTQLSDDDFRQKMTTAIDSLEIPDDSAWQTFAGSLFYRPVIYDDASSYTHLSTFLQDLDQKHKTRGNKIFYLALPPTLYRPVARMLGKAGLSNEDSDANGWARLVVEKPFGRDLESAIELDQGIHEYFQEHQIFRIDHYLAKETVQNVLMLRFANAIFEPVWNRRYIENISITATETLGVEHRAGYYEQSGVLRDMFQNHMMQLLALTAMEPPSRFVAEHVRDERIKVFRALRPFPIDKLREHLALGQYDAGRINGQAVPAYRQEPGVNPDSLTPTFARMKVFVDNWRWQGVPFYLTSGKRLAQKITEIAIQFKEVPHSMFRRIMGGDITANRLILGIYPEEKITLTFQTKFPGAQVCLRSVTMDFNYHQNYNGPVLEAYEKVLLDCMLGDHMLFWRQDGVELCWNFLTPVLSECETCGYRADMLQFYKSGSRGTAGAESLTAT
jgi:glucose-6-phosphate 1-dehydrogenase